jgi:hypothetical protein
MIGTCHIAVGAAMGKLLRRPWLAWPVAYASHFVLDAVPHVDPHAVFGLASGAPTQPEVFWGVVDTVVAVALGLWLVWGQKERWTMVGGAFFAILPDLLCDPWLDWDRAGWLLVWLRHVHRLCHYDTLRGQWLLGAANEAAVVAVSVWAARFRHARRSATAGETPAPRAPAQRSAPGAPAQRPAPGAPAQPPPMKECETCETSGKSD